MDEKALEAVARAMFDADRGGASMFCIARAAIEAYEAALNATGLVIVPRDPTDKMQLACHKTLISAAMMQVECGEAAIWQAMIAAAPDQR